jgi:hypothetical protein
MRALAIVTAAALSLGACSSQKPARPTGPSPEYERPVVMPWDSGTPVDPLENAEGEEVTDDEPMDAGSDPIPTGDAALSPDPPTS